MPGPTAIITTKIPAQNFEVIRDRIGLILGLELAKQYTLDNTIPNVKKVWIDRFLILNDTEIPTVIVGIARGEYSNETQKKADGSYLFDIDVCTRSPSNSTTGPGDQYAMTQMNKIVGMVRAILSLAQYNNAGNVLLLGPGIIDARIERFFVAYKNGDVKDALSDVVGRIQYNVKCIESFNLTPTLNTLDEVTTSIKLNGSDQGYFYDLKMINVTVVTTGATLTNAGFNIPILEIVIGDNTFYADKDFTQAGTTITATTFEFQSGQKIIATT